MERSTLVGVPSGDDWKAKFGISLTRMVIYSMTHGKGSVTVDNKNGSILPQMRQQLAETALKMGCSHLLFVDSDQSFPPDTLERLLAWNKPVVGCNVATKAIPASPTARKINPEDDRGKPLFTRPGQTGLERVWRFGCGIMLIQTWVFNEIEKPWFPIRYRPEREDFQGEDWGFCELLDKKDIQLYVDQGLSWEVGHWGKFEYGHDLIHQQLLAQELQEEEEVLTNAG